MLNLLILNQSLTANRETLKKYFWNFYPKSSFWTVVIIINTILNIYFHLFPRVIDQQKFINDHYYYYYIYRRQHLHIQLLYSSVLVFHLYNHRRKQFIITNIIYYFDTMYFVLFYFLIPILSTFPMYRTRILFEPLIIFYSENWKITMYLDISMEEMRFTFSYSFNCPNIPHT